VDFTGQLADPDRTDYQVQTTSEQIQIQLEYHRPLFSGFVDPAVQLEVRVPQEVPVRVETFDAPVILRDLRGEVEVHSTSGDILAENLSGEILLRSARGDVRAVNCSGIVQVLGEHGILALEDVRGEVGASTIMGTIRYTGAPGSGDEVNLETDHGPVQIELGKDSGLDISMTTTSGEIDCSLPGLTFSSRSCSGILGNGAGSLTVRTVSGEVTLRLAP
jgi:DUF4097 and DUF4098 domain-containing protein YvlB